MSRPLDLRRRYRRGNFAVIVALSFTVLLAFAALAIDISYIRLSQIQAQNAADAGAHAALVALRFSGDEDIARGVAVDVTSENLIAGSSVTIDSNTNIDFGGWEFDGAGFDDDAVYNNAVRVTVQRDDANDNPINLIIAPLLGWMETADVGATATGALRFRDVMIVMDHTGSFQDEFPDAKQAALDFLDYMWNDGSPFPGDRVGMVSFVGEATLYSELAYLQADYAALESKWNAELDWCARDHPLWQTYYGGAYYHEAPGMIPCCATETDSTSYTDCSSIGDSGTNQGSGINRAVDHFLDVSDTNTLKTIVLVSDGKPQCVPSASVCDSGRAAEGVDAAAYAEDNNISVFSVSFNDPPNTNQSLYLESLVRGYGSFYETPDSSDLPGILEDIASQIPVALVE